MRIALRILAVSFIASVLTIITQVGGIIFLISLMAYPLISPKFKNTVSRISAKFFFFMILYSFCSIVIVPVIAKNYYDRVPLPMFESNGLKPMTMWTCILNRNYVRTTMRMTTFNVASSMQKQFPGTIVNYIDASFPIGNHFKIFPHLSHGDGRKVDFAFLYVDVSTNQPSNTSPSWSGYNVYEGPLGNEVNQQAICRQKGFWQGDFFPGRENDHKVFLFDEARTKALTNSFASETTVEKIFIEPHLEARLGLTNPKIRFQGCHAARHDDHIHVQVK